MDWHTAATGRGFIGITKYAAERNWDLAETLARELGNGWLRLCNNLCTAVRPV